MNRWQRLEHLTHVESLSRAGELRELREWEGRLENDLACVLEQKDQAGQILVRAELGTVADMQMTYAYLADLRKTVQTLEKRIAEARRMADDVEEAVREKHIERERFRILLTWEAEKARFVNLRREQEELDAVAARYIQMRAQGAESDS